MKQVDPARGRFIRLAVLRLSGAVMVGAGAVLIARGHYAPEGMVLLVVGFVDAMVLPIVLAKRWKSRA